MLSKGLEVSASKSDMLKLSEALLVQAPMEATVMGTGVNMEYCEADVELGIEYDIL
jgi:hypothetical protein